MQIQSVCSWGYNVKILKSSSYNKDFGDVGYESCQEVEVIFDLIVLGIWYPRAISLFASEVEVEIYIIVIEVVLNCNIRSYCNL